MYEYIFPRLALDKAKAFAGVKPLHGSLFFAHFVFLFSSLKLSGALLRIPSRECFLGRVLWMRSAGTKKGRKFDLATASQNQRRYKSNKRNFTLPQTPVFCKGIFPALARTASAKTILLQDNPFWSALPREFEQV